jgi:hypothetical protein
MSAACQYPLCRNTVPTVLEREGFCPLHFLKRLDAQCSEIRRETLGGRLDGHRSAEINEFLSTRAAALAQLATCGARLRDDARPCLLSVFLALVNLGERVARASGEDKQEVPLVAMRPRLVAQSSAGMK